jgi:hypothetical protein
MIPTQKDGYETVDGIEDMEGDWGNLQVHARFLDENCKASRLVNGIFVQ